MTAQNGDFNQYLTWKQNLSSLLEESLESFEYLQMETETSVVSVSLGKITNDTFKVMVIGNYNTGKSTFINALLGSDVLPTDILPCTAVVNEVKYSKEKKAVVHFKNPLPQNYANLVSDKAQKYISKHSVDIPPIEIPIRELNDYVVIANPEVVQEGSQVETPVEKVEIFWPIELCERGVEIIDSPGLEDDNSRTQVVLNYFNKVDAVLFVVNSNPGPQQNEIAFVDNIIRKSGHEYIFFVCNKIDLISDKDRDRMKNFIRGRLKGKTLLEDGIHFISASQALHARLNDDRLLLDDSGILRLDNSLSKFLTKDKGKIKLLAISKECIGAVRLGLDERIPFLKRLFNTDLVELERKYAELQPRLEKLEHDKEVIVNRINERIKRLRPSINTVVSNHFESIAHRVPYWTKEINLQNEISFWSPRDSSKKIIQETLDKLQSKIMSEQEVWAEQTFNLMLENHVRDMMNEFQKDYQNFHVELADIKTDILSLNTNNVGIREISIGERAGAAVLGLLVGDIGAAIFGGAVGFDKSLLKQIMMQLGLVFTAMLLGILNPFVLLGLILSGSFFHYLMKSSKATDDLKIKVGQLVQEKLIEGKDQQAKEMTDKVIERIEEYMRPIKKSLESEINSLRKQVEFAIQEKRKGHAHVKAKMDELDSHERSLKKVETTLNDFTFELAGLISQN
ncbi:MAG: dynamin family protein [Bacteroidia bacterium]